MMCLISPGVPQEKPHKFFPEMQLCRQPVDGPELDISTPPRRSAVGAAPADFGRVEDAEPDLGDE